MAHCLHHIYTYTLVHKPKGVPMHPPPPPMILHEWYHFLQWTPRIDIRDVARKKLGLTALFGHFWLFSLNSLTLKIWVQRPKSSLDFHRPRYWNFHFRMAEKGSQSQFFSWQFTEENDTTHGGWGPPLAYGLTI